MCLAHTLPYASYAPLLHSEDRVMPFPRLSQRFALNSTGDGQIEINKKCMIWGPGYLLTISTPMVVPFRKVSFVANEGGVPGQSQSQRAQRRGNVFISLYLETKSPSPTLFGPQVHSAETPWFPIFLSFIQKRLTSYFIFSKGQKYPSVHLSMGNSHWENFEWNVCKKGRKERQREREEEEGRREGNINITNYICVWIWIWILTKCDHTSQSSKSMPQGVHGSRE